MPHNKSGKYVSYSTQSRIRCHRKIKGWRTQVFERDGHRCILCRSVENLTAHHLIAWMTSPELRFEIDNGVTLCRKCHDIIEGKLHD